MKSTIKTIIIYIFFTSAAYADDPDAMINFLCNYNNETLTISQFFEEAKYDAEYPRTIKRTDTTISARGLMWATESATGEVEWKNRSIIRSCTIGKSKFIAILEGYKYKASGRCSGGTPTLSLTLQKDGVPIINRLSFIPNDCSNPENIQSIKFSNTSNSVEVSTLNTITMKSEIKNLPVKAVRSNIYWKEEPN